MDLASQIAECKIQNKLSIISREIEEKRLNKFADFAKQIGLNPDFAKSILYLIIGEACRIEMEEQYK